MANEANYNATDNQLHHPSPPMEKDFSHGTLLYGKSTAPVLIMYQTMATTTVSEVMSTARQHFEGFVRLVASRSRPSYSKNCTSLLRTRLLVN
jgi:hypothetical protein